jgi:hypothetical protein
MNGGHACNLDYTGGRNLEFHRGHPRQKTSETLISTSKLGMVVHACHLCYPEDIGKKITV